MILPKKYLIVAIVSCFLSAITTLGIHSSLFDLGPLSFEERLLLYQNTTYLANRFWVILHCLFVLISMWGFCLLQIRKSPGFTGLGFVFFAVFSFTEIFRQMFVFFYLNGIRQSYMVAETTVKQVLVQNMDSAGLFGYALFGLFIFAFSLGNICYGIALFGNKRFDNVLGILLLIWGILNLVAFGNEFWHSTTINVYIEYFSLFYQPLMRVLLAIWLWLQLKEKFSTRDSKQLEILKI